MTQDYIPFPQIVAELKRLCDQRVTGTLFVATKANRSAQVSIEQGEIVFVYFFNKRGEEALELMSTIQAGRFRFQEGAVAGRGPLPPTDTILRSLGGGPVAAVAAPQGKAVAPGSGLSPEQISVLEECLARYIGPMARLICEDHLAGAPDLPAAVEALSAEIPSPEQAEKFRALVVERLG